jgi:hypothetical protein
MTKIFDSNGKELTNFKNYGTPEAGTIILVDEEKITQEVIQQLRNYLDSQEKKLKVRK